MTHVDLEGHQILTNLHSLVSRAAWLQYHFQQKHYYYHLLQSLSKCDGESILTGKTLVFEILSFSVQKMNYFWKHSQHHHWLAEWLAHSHLTAVWDSVCCQATGLLPGGLGLLLGTRSCLPRGWLLRSGLDPRVLLGRGWLGSRVDGVVKAVVELGVKDKLFISEGHTRFLGGRLELSRMLNKLGFGCLKFITCRASTALWNGNWWCGCGCHWWCIHITGEATAHCRSSRWRTNWSRRWYQIVRHNRITVP